MQAIAVCLLHAYAEPAARGWPSLESGARLWPEVAVVASHQITREWREYERSSTAVLSAYVQPVAERYLTRLATRLGGRGFGGQVYVMQSNCGVDSLERPAGCRSPWSSPGRPAASGARPSSAELIGEPNVLALDIGGTTAKCSLIEDGHVKIMTDYWIERYRRSAGYPIMVPVVDLVEIGNGGGSIAWVDDFGKLHVGPRSAGADARARRLTAAAARGDDHRRQPRARPDQQRLFLRRRRSPPTWTPSNARSTRSPPSSASTGSRRRAGSCASPTTTWSTR